MTPAKSEGIETRYQSNRPGTYWIKISNANKLRDKALEAEREKYNKMWWEITEVWYPIPLKQRRVNRKWRELLEIKKKYENTKPLRRNRRE